jgi:hypothetical protein
MPIITNTVDTSMIQLTRKININILHSLVGHAGEAYTKATAEVHGWKWTGQWFVSFVQWQNPNKNCS